MARSAFDQWAEDPKAEIFMERDGEGFRYCFMEQDIRKRNDTLFLNTGRFQCFVSRVSKDWKCMGQLAGRF